MFRFFLLLIAILVFAVVAVWAVAIGAAMVGGVVGYRKLKQRAAARRLKRASDAQPADPLEHAWAQVAGQADWAVSRVATVRTSCARLIAIADADPLAADAVDWANVIRRRVPDLVAADRKSTRLHPVTLESRMPSSA